MKIKEQANKWPPMTTGANLQADLCDSVQSAQRDATLHDHIGLGMRRGDGTEYGASLVLPAKVIDKAAIAIVKRLPLALEDLGEMEI